VCRQTFLRLLYDFLERFGESIDVAIGYGGFEDTGTGILRTADFGKCAFRRAVKMNCS
jgi:hypothetical protein